MGRRKDDVLLRRLHLRVAEKLTDHGQRHPAGNQQRSEGMAKIVNAMLQVLPFLNIVPEPFDLLHGLLVRVTGKHPWAFFRCTSADRAQKLHGRA